MANKTMKTLTIGENTYEIYDESARTDIATLQMEVSQLSEEIVDLKGGEVSGISAELTSALVDYYTHVMPEFDDPNGLSYINAILTALGAETRGEEPEEPDTPIEPEITLSSISAVYTGGDVTAGTALADLTGITVTATYSDGSTATVTGYTLSGTIAEGSNTITVSYGGKTTTFTVTGIAESGGEDTDGFVNLFSANLRTTIQEDVTAGIGSYVGNYVNTDADIQLTAGVTYYAYSLFNGTTCALTVFKNDGLGVYSNSGLTATKKKAWLTSAGNNSEFTVDIDGTSYYLYQMSFTPTEDCAVRLAFHNKCVGHTYPDYNYLFTKEYNPHLDSLS